MIEERKKRGPFNLILICIAGVFVAAVVATLITIVIIGVTDLLLFTRPPSVPFGVWRWKTFERIHLTFVMILWGLSFFGALVSLFKEPFENWGRRKLDGEK